MARGLILVAGLLVMNVLAAAQSLEISEQDQQIWLVWPDGKREQLTHGPQNASAPAWSADHTSIAFFRYCPSPAQCNPALVMVNRSGNILKEFSLAATSNWGGCGAVMKIDFLDSNRIGFECHINPSLDEYTTMDPSSGQLLKHWLGFAFTWSPDKSHIAYHGWIPHFSPPFGHSSYLQIDDQTVYPPEAITGAAFSEGPHGVKLEMHSIIESGGLYRNIHDFHQFFWAPDSKKVAFIDRVYDWKEVENQPQNIGEQNAQRFLVISGVGIKPSRLPVVKNCNLQGRIEWRNENELDLLCGADSTRYAIDKIGILSESKKIQ